MDKKVIKIFKLIAFIIALTGILLSFFGVILNPKQYRLIGRILFFVSAFTNWTNIILTMYFFITCFLPDSKIGKWLNKDYVKSAILLYILFICAGFHFLIRVHVAGKGPGGFWGWGPQISHYITPMLMLIDWLLSKPVSKIKFKHTVVWLLYPIIYSLFIIIRGYFLGLYPYYFLNVSELGIGRVLINILGFCCAYLILGNLIAFISNLRLKLFK